MFWNININLWASMLITIVIMSIILWWLLWKLIYDYILENKQKDLQSLIEKAQNKSNEILEKARENAEKQAENILEKAEKQATTLIERLESKEEKISKKEKELLEKELELDKKIKEEENKLFKIANLDPNEAKQLVFDKTEKEFEQDLVNMVEKVKNNYQDIARTEASNLIAKTVYRVAVEWTNKFLASTVQLPSEDFKWKIIGREWRNIQFFEKITWVNLSMDDTPEVVKISSFDPEKRFIAKITLEKLIQDWRINPVYIEKHYKETANELPEILKEIWKETLLELWIPMMQPEILEYIGRFELRYSYWQNLLEHSKEVAKISELLANELWYDGLLAKKAGLLHDIWKIDVNSWESHAKVGADILRKFNFKDEVINAAESHHFEVQPSNPISWIVAAADTISAWREWARNNQTEHYIERIKALESLVTSIDWVKKAYIMQAGREIWAFVDEENISDLDAQKLNKHIKHKVEENLDYPWIIKIVTIRENKITSYIS